MPECSVRLKHRNVMGRSPGNKIEKAGGGLTMKSFERYPVCLGDLLDYKTCQKYLLKLRFANSLPGMGPRELEFSKSPS